MRWIPIALGVTAATVIGVLASIFIVDEREQAIVLQFGQVTRVATEPGMYWRVPLLQEVAFYEGRILPVETSELEVTPADERR
ncbi:MAG: SPFH domain-containing protein, partial [Pseudomonadota bacterium]